MKPPEIPGGRFFHKENTMLHSWHLEPTGIDDYVYLRNDRWLDQLHGAHVAGPVVRVADVSPHL